MASGTPSNNGRKLSHSTWHPPRSPAPVTQEEKSPENGASALRHSPEGASRTRLRKKPSFNMKVCDSGGGLLLGHDTFHILTEYVLRTYYTVYGTISLYHSFLCKTHSLFIRLLLKLYAESTAQALKNIALRPRRVRR